MTTTYLNLEASLLPYHGFDVYFLGGASQGSTVNRYYPLWLALRIPISIVDEAGASLNHATTYQIPIAH